MSGCVETGENGDEKSSVGFGGPLLHRLTVRCFHRARTRAGPRARSYGRACVCIPRGPFCRVCSDGGGVGVLRRYELTEAVLTR
ncbi:hypothetical protein BDW71DRAFT_186016, partial [Aspergillus fruticulosus]